MRSRYLKNASPPVWSWYPFVSTSFPSFMATFIPYKHCSYARKMWETPPPTAGISTGNDTTPFVLAPNPLSTLYTVQYEFEEILL